MKPPTLDLILGDVTYARALTSWYGLEVVALGHVFLNERTLCGRTPKTCHGDDWEANCASCIKIARRRIRLCTCPS